MLATHMKVKELIKKYEERIESKKEQQEKNHNDIVEGVIIALEDVVEDLKKLQKTYTDNI